MNETLMIPTNKQYQQWMRHNRYGMFNDTPLKLYELHLRGTIEPHERLLNQPTILIYKFIKFDHLIRSVNDHYPHFNRVDSYKDFEVADKNDGDQTLGDRAIHQKMNFVKGGCSLETYYDETRSRSYACCFTTEKKISHVG